MLSESQLAALDGSRCPECGHGERTIEPRGEGLACDNCGRWWAPVGWCTTHQRICGEPHED